MHVHPHDTRVGARPERDGWRGQVTELVCIFALIFLCYGTPPPDVNEAHYLVKAKHFWDPSWCASDVFLDSADAHPVFYWLFGWPTLWVSLATATWCGRLVVWAAVTWSWQRLSWSIVPYRYASVLTAAWFLTLNHTCQLAGEWAVGGLEAKGAAYALVFWALGSLVSGRWSRAWIALGAATALHVLVGGWSLIAAAIAWLLAGADRPALRSMWPGLLVGGGLALAGLLPALWLTADVDRATASTANMIYVFDRLSHHLVFHRFAPDRLLVFSALLVVWMMLSWSVAGSTPWLRLHRFAQGALVIAVVGIGLDLLLLYHRALAAELLRFYWFRLVDVAVPLAIAFGVPLAIDCWSGARRPARRALWGLAVAAPLLLLGTAFVERQLDFRPGGIVQSSPAGFWTRGSLVARTGTWQDICRWAADHTDPQARFLTPRNQQTFKWYAQRSEVACWKDIPQDPASIVAWSQLLREIYPLAVIERGLGAWSDDQLRAIAARQQIHYILVDRAYTKRRLGFRRVYPESPREEAWFELYELDR